MSQRSKQLFAMVDEYNRVHHEWANSGDNRPYPDATYWDALDEMVQVFRVGDIPHECRSLEEVVFKLALETKKWDDRLDANKQMPPQSFFSVREELEKTRQGEIKLSEPVVLEPIDELHRQGVNPNQIARMWGIERWQVLQYLIKDKDGNRSWNLPSDHKPPADRIKAAEEATARTSYESAVRRRDEVRARDNAPPAESVEELLKQQVSPKQIARMHRITEFEVGQIAQKAGIQLPPNVTVQSLRNTEPPATPAIGVGTSPALGIQSDKPTDVQAEILRLAEQRYTNGEIAQNLQAFGVTEEQVMKTLAQASKPRGRMKDVKIPEKEQPVTRPEPETVGSASS